MARHGENIRKRKDGRWEARVACDCRDNGKKRYKYLYAHSYDEVRRRKNELMNGGAADSMTEKDRKETVETLMEEWLCSVQCHTKESTLAKYKFFVYKHIIPELGGILLMHLNSGDIEQFKIRKLTGGRLDKKGGLAPKTVTDLLSILKLALIYGTEKKYFVEGQIKIRNPKQWKPQINILTSEEQEQLVAGLLEQDDNSHLGIIIALYAGLRIGEICALRWGDIDFTKATLQVCRTVMRIMDYNSGNTAKTKVIIESPKTECSRRLIPIPGKLLDYLSRYRKEDLCYVITGKKSFTEPRNYYRKYKKL